jgi:hypothetical protein
MEQHNNFGSIAGVSQHDTSLEEVKKPLIDGEESRPTHYKHNTAIEKVRGHFSHLRQQRYDKWLNLKT